MTPQFTPEQRDALIAQHGHVVYFVDVVTREEYAVLPAEQFRQVEPLLDTQESLDPREFYPLVDQAWQPILDDSALDEYAEDYLAPRQT
jgi:hypothetical protein